MISIKEKVLTWQVKSFKSTRNIPILENESLEEFVEKFLNRSGEFRLGTYYHYSDMDKQYLHQISLAEIGTVKKEDHDNLPF